MIKLTEINKIYRTNEIETVALENVNLEVEKGEFLQSLIILRQSQLISFHPLFLTTYRGTTDTVNVR